MKKLFLAFTFLFVILSVKAQDIRQFWFGGNIGFSTHKEDNIDRLNNYTVLPEIGYVLNENLGIGLNAGYFSEDIPLYNSSGNHQIENRAGFVVNPFLRYTFLKGNIGGLFIDGGVSYKYGTGAEVWRDDNKEHTFSIGLRPGVAISISDKVSLTGKFGFLGYETTQTKYKANGIEYETNADDIKFNFNFENILLGINFVF